MRVRWLRRLLAAAGGCMVIAAVAPFPSLSTATGLGAIGLGVAPLSGGVEQADRLRFALALPGLDVGPDAARGRSADPDLAAPDRPESEHRHSGSLDPASLDSASLDSASLDSGPPPAPQPLEHRRVTVSKGDSLFTIFKANALSLAALQQLMDSGEVTRRLTRILPGQTLDFWVDPDDGLQRLDYRIDETLLLRFERAVDGFSSALIEEQLEARPTHAFGDIDSSLFLAGQAAGLSDAVIMRMVEIFAWDIDFALEVRSGDRFTVVYETLYKEGELVREGEILAAEFVNRGRVIRAVRYADPSGRTGYFTPDGLSMRKAFLRTPVEFSRISSKFDLKRKHPVLHTIRAHRGVDYAAPTGTPIKATGDGKVTYVGRKGGYGKVVVLRHGETYTTLYAHLSRFARNLRAGGRVSQGEVIGYVGSTGLATGPHLHYEFQVRGAHRDPLTVPLPKAEPVAREFMADFSEQTRALASRLDVLARTRVASTE